MCYTWVKQTWAPELSLHQVRRLVADPLIGRSLEVLNVAGGEPTLRDDLVEIVGAFAEGCRSLRSVDIPTNGFQPARVVDQVERLLAVLALARIELVVTVSVDGVGEVHERIRRREGVFPQVHETIQALKELRDLYPRLHLGMNTVISRGNAQRGALDAVRAYARAHAIGINFSPAAISEVGVESAPMASSFSLEPRQRDGVARFFEQLQLERAIDPVYGDFVLQWLRTGRRSLGCAFRQGKNLLVEPNGDAYLCGNYKDFRLGNLLEHSLSELWPAQRRFTRAMWSRRCDTCASNCYLGAI